MKLKIPVERNIVFSRKSHVYKPAFGQKQNCKGNLNSGAFYRVALRAVFSAVDPAAQKFRVL